MVRFDKAYRLQFQKDAQNPYFIFGGDLADRGVGDIQLAETLLDFKRRFPKRVFLLVGNRETSKTRFHIELNPKHIRTRLLKGSVPFWLLQRPHQLPVDYVKKAMEAAGKTPQTDAKIEAYLNQLDIPECQLIYLKWMLEQNLGCPHTFEYHAHQFARLQGVPREEISDLTVLARLIAQNAPTGLMGEYLQHTQMVSFIPEAGIMAVHGGLTAENIGRLPSAPEVVMPAARHWIKAMNAWYREAVDEWVNTEQETLPLVLTPARMKMDTFSEQVPVPYRSIVTASMLGANRQFQAVPEVVSNYLKQDGISMVLTGHQPSGDHPAILRAKDDSVLFVNGDISYANAHAGDVHDTRGLAWHSIYIRVDKAQAVLNLEASLQSGQQLKHAITMKNGRVVDDTHIGKLLPGGELVQCRLPHAKKYYRTLTQEGFEVTYKFRTASEIDEILACATVKDD